MKRLAVGLIVLLISPVVAIGISQQAAIDRGVNWLVDNQLPDGSWGIDIPFSVKFTDTIQTTNSLFHLKQATATFTKGAKWVSQQEVVTVPQLAVKIETLAKQGMNVSTEVSLLASYQNPDGGFGEDGDCPSNVEDSALVLRAFMAARYSNAGVLDSLKNYLIVNQNLMSDYAFSVGGRLSGANETLKESSVEVTALVIDTFERYGITGYETYIDKAANWLMAQQNPDGSFGNSVWETASALLALIGNWKLEIEKLNLIVDYILSQQLENGAWNENAYETALAIRGLWESLPNLSIGPEDITFSKENPIEDETITITARIWNRGMSVARDFGWQMTDGSEQIIKEGMIEEILPGEYGVVQATWSGKAGEHTIKVVVDPENVIFENNEEDNEACKTITVRPKPDITITNLNFSNENPAENEEIFITVTITNDEITDLEDVEVEFRCQVLGDRCQAIGQKTIEMIRKGASEVVEITWSGTYGDYIISAIVDPQNLIPESNEENNEII